MPWANGGGVTLEVARDPECSAAGDWVWRVSVAAVQADGDFSLLPGVDRIIVLAEGRWMLLTVDGGEHVLQPGQPFAFSGDDKVFCAVPSPTRDLNVMTRRGAATASVEVIEPAAGACVEAGEADHLIIMCARGPLWVKGSSGRTAYLGDFDAALCDPPEAVTVNGPGCVAVVRIRLINPDPRADSPGSRPGARRAVPSAQGR